MTEIAYYIPLSWPKVDYIGPKVLEETKGRSPVKFLHCQNETPSLKNLVFSDPKDPPTCDDILKRTPQRKGPIKIHCSSADILRLKSDVEIIREYKDSIYLMAQRRIAAYYQQLILGYRTKLHFEEGKTVDQAESAATLSLSSVKQNLPLKMDASHSNTIPCLYAYDKEEWDAYQASLKQSKHLQLAKPQGFIYMKGSDGYRFWNSTLEMPKLFNTSVDNTIDLGQKGLRKVGLNILNRSAKGNISPEDGLKEFVDSFLYILNREYKAALKENKEAKGLGLKLYRKELLRIQETLENDDESFHYYLNIKVNPNDQAEDIKKVIYEIRYQSIQKNFSKQAEIAQKIENIRHRIFSSFKRLPAYAEEAFRELIIENSTTLDAIRVKKYFNSPYELRKNSTRARNIEIAKKKLSEARIRTKPGSRKREESGLEAIQRLSNKISRIMHTMRINEQAERGATIRKLRNMRNWTQSKLAAKIKKHYPHISASQPTLSRCETGIRIVDCNYATKLSQVFKVDPALFMPQFFNE